MGTRAAAGAGGTATPDPLSWFSRSVTAQGTGKGAGEGREATVRLRRACAAARGGRAGKRRGAVGCGRSSVRLGAAGRWPLLQQPAHCLESCAAAAAVPTCHGVWALAAPSRQRLPALSALEMVFFSNSFSRRSTSRGGEDSPCSARGATGQRATFLPAAGGAQRRRRRSAEARAAIGVAHCRGAAMLGRLGTGRGARCTQGVRAEAPSAHRGELAPRRAAPIAAVGRIYLLEAAPAAAGALLAAWSEPLLVGRQGSEGGCGVQAAGLSLGASRRACWARLGSGSGVVEEGGGETRSALSRSRACQLRCAD